MEIYDPLKKEIKTYTGEESTDGIPSELISAKESSRDYSLSFCMKLSFKTMWPRAILSSGGFLLFLIFMNAVIYYGFQGSSTPFWYYIVFDSALFVFDFFFLIFAYAMRMKNGMSQSPTYLEIYEDFIQVKENNESGKVIFKVPFSSFFHVITMKEAYLMEYHIENGMKGMMILYKKSIQESALERVDQIIKSINEKHQNENNR